MREARRSNVAAVEPLEDELELDQLAGVQTRARYTRNSAGERNFQTIEEKTVPLVGPSQEQTFLHE